MPPAAQQWLAPVGVRPTGDGIEWLPAESLARDGVITPERRLLEEFLQLRDASTQQVAAFARRHGVLGLRRKSRPRLGQYVHEPLGEWHAAAELAHALTTAANKLRSGIQLSDDERVPVLAAASPEIRRQLLSGRLIEYHTGEVFYEPEPDPEGEWRAALLEQALRTVSDDRDQVAWTVTRWMSEAGAGLALLWPPVATTPALAIGGETARGCLAAITVQVALACAGSDETRTCSGCRELFTPGRRTPAGKRPWCPKCRKNGEPGKQAKRDQRARERVQVAG